MRRILSFPYLAIAKRYNIAYEDVLLLAGTTKQVINEENRERVAAIWRKLQKYEATPDFLEALEHIGVADIIFDYVRADYIEYETGLPKQDLGAGINASVCDAIEFQGTLHAPG